MSSVGSVLIVLLVSTYILARLATIAEQSKWEEIKRKKEEARMKHLDGLYGRDDESL